MSDHGNNDLEDPKYKFYFQGAIESCHQFITHFPDSGAKPRKARGVCNLE